MDMVERVLLKWWAGKWNLKKRREGRKRIWRLMRKDPWAQEVTEMRSNVSCGQQEGFSNKWLWKENFSSDDKVHGGTLTIHEKEMIISNKKSVDWGANVYGPCPWMRKSRYDGRLGVDREMWAGPDLQWTRSSHWEEEMIDWGTLGVYSVSMDLNVFPQEHWE